MQTWPSTNGFASMPFASGVAIWSGTVDAGADPRNAWLAFLAGIGAGAWAGNNPRGVRTDGTVGALPAVPYPSSVVLAAYQISARIVVLFATEPARTFTHPAGWPVEPRS